MIITAICILIMVTGRVYVFSDTEGNEGRSFSDRLMLDNSAIMHCSLSLYQDAQQMMEIDKGDLLGQINAEGDERFVTVASKHGGNGQIYLRAEVYDAFIAMYEAGLADGVKLVIISGFRTFDHQVRIWEGKWNGRRQNWRTYSRIVSEKERAEAILKYSAMPGTSRHHWGTDIDLNSLSPAYFRSNEGLKVYQWLREHGPTYGFCQPYSAKGDDRPTGHFEEQWHWSYLPVSRYFQKQYSELIGYDDITGFDGAYLASSLRIIEDYVNGIAPDCK